MRRCSRTAFSSTASKNAVIRACLEGSELRSNVSGPSRTQCRAHEPDARTLHPLRQQTNIATGTSAPTSDESSRRRGFRDQQVGWCPHKQCAPAGANVHRSSERTIVRDLHRQVARHCQPYKKRLLIVFGNAHALSRRNGPQQVRTAAAGWPPYINELRPLSLLAVTQRSQKLSVAADTEIVQRRCFGLNKIEQKLFDRLRVQLS